MEHVFVPRAAAAARSRLRPSLRHLVFAAAVLLLLSVAAQIVTGWGGGSVDFFFGTVLYNTAALLAGLCCMLHRSGTRVERVAWVLLGAGLASWGVGNIYYGTAFFDVPADEIPFPSPADVGFLAVYPFVFVGLGLLARSQLVRFTRTSWIDGLIAGLTVGALAAAAVFQPVLESTGGSVATVATNLAYPLGDLILLAVIVGALGLGGWRFPPPWILLSLGLGCFSLADSFYLVQVANGTYTYGSLVDLGWVGGMVLIALGSLVRSGRVRASGHERALPYVPATFGLVGVGIMTYDHFDQVGLLTLVLTAASLLAVVARMMLSLLENGRMLRTSREEAVTDALTGLRNRRKLQADLDELLEQGHGAHSVLLMFDLDGFKGYNDSFGHPAGDALLARLAERLAHAADTTGTAYRLGGDEFCLLAPGDFASIDELRERASAALSEDGDGFSIRSSCGVAVLPDEAATASAALRLVDLRMYEQKNSRPSAGKQTTNVLLSALQERDPALADHTGHVATLAAEVARELGLEGEAVERVALAAQLHDIGKIAVPESIIGKPGKLSDAEWEFIERHTLIGERIVSAAPALASAGDLIRSSHERWDGKGYPDRLRGDAIPLGSRIVFVCDSFDAMTNDRPYAPGISSADACAELRRNAGSQFDPAIVDALLRVLARRSLRSAA